MTSALMFQQTIHGDELLMNTDTTTAVIIGGTSGIGRATAHKMALLGIHVLVVGRSVEHGERTVAEIRAAEWTLDFYVPSDLRDASELA